MTRLYRLLLMAHHVVLGPCSIVQQHQSTDNAENFPFVVGLDVFTHEIRSSMSSSSSVTYHDYYQPSYYHFGSSD